jgi:hypothetical protein
LFIPVHTGTDEYYIHKFLKDVRKITGYLLVFSSTGLKDLSFFKNLVQIDGNDLWNDRYPTESFITCVKMTACRD